MSRFTLAIVVLIVVLIGFIVFSLLPRFEKFTRPEIKVAIPEVEKIKEVTVETKGVTVAFDLGHESKFSPFEEYSRFTSLFRASESKIKAINETVKDLEGVAVLIVISPSTTYTKEEIDAIESAVKNGMTLVLLGEKETASKLNQLSANFGILFNKERIFDLSNYWLFYRNPILGEFANHTVTKDLVKAVVHDACSLTVVKPAEVVVYTKETAVQR